MSNRVLVSSLIVLFVNLLTVTFAEEPQLPEFSERRSRAMEFHLRAQERTGVLVPMYVYPANIHITWFGTG